jgi:hypothetical protein
MKDSLENDESIKKYKKTFDIFIGFKYNKMRKMMMEIT